MSSNYELFFTHKTFAVIGHSSTRPFPRLTYGGLKKLGKTVFPIDTSADSIDGDRTYKDLASLPQPVEAVVVEVAKAETAAYVAQAAQAGIKDLWLHMNSDTPEALQIAKSHGINVRSGTCAVMYVTPGLTFHSIHRMIMKIRKKY